MSRTQVVILAAGMGTRLGGTVPKPLTVLAEGRTILAQQVDNVRAVFDDAAITVVVGFQKELIMDAQPDATFVYNERFAATNTNRSLLKALRASAEGGVVWMNGDVVFDPALLQRLRPAIEGDRSVLAVNTATVAEEEVKYTVDDNGLVLALSKQVEGGLGEAVGINFVAESDKMALIERLAECSDHDYFERGIELSIAKDGMAVLPVDISDLFAVEVDFEDDLARANARPESRPT